MTWIFVYDIGDDDIRDAVARTLEQFGERVQESVFECRLDNDELQGLTLRLQVALRKPDAGEIRVYRACADCMSASFGMGTVGSTIRARACTVI